MWENVREPFHGWIVSKAWMDGDLSKLQNNFSMTYCIFVGQGIVR
jgi:hypothetical protein